MSPDLAAWTLPLTALTTGFLGSVHCLGMCGGISATVAMASPLPANPRPGTFRTLPIRFAAIPLSTGARAPLSSSTAGANVLAFNVGRIASYAVAGAMAGTLGGVFAGLGQGWVINETMAARTTLFVFANLMIIFTGLYLVGMPQFLAPLERAGGHLWRHISPWSRKFLPLRSPAHAAVFGALWGWIPCGMVYAMLLTAMSAGSATGGTTTMLAFGIGTLPAMLGAGWSVGHLRNWTRKPSVRLTAGIAVVTMGLFGLARIGTLERLQEFGIFCSSLMTPAIAGLIAR